MLKLPLVSILNVVSLLCEPSSRGATPHATDILVAKKVLIIGIDGCRTDALLAARAPHLHALIRDGSFSDKTNVLPDRKTGADTISGPGWSAILTGVWADKHGVRDNYFQGSNFKEFPHFFTRLKKARPNAFTASVATWEPIHKRIVSDADISLATRRGQEPYRDADARGVAKVIQLLSEQDPTAVFIHLDQVDDAGHQKGFSPKVAEYLAAIEQVDSHVGRILDAIRARKTYPTEDWLIIVCTDHGGKGRDHARGQGATEIRQVVVIVSGGLVAKGKIEGPVGLVDVAATALTHLGVNLDPAWHLDGRAVGLQK
jgi:predicted AlkP superfamily pyrophosphatase or phosphodiesterase